ncbi:hypothetical protein Tco_0227665 [Tanacetum coccineum]
MAVIAIPVLHHVRPVAAVTPWSIIALRLGIGDSVVVGSVTGVDLVALFGAISFKIPKICKYGARYGLGVKVRCKGWSLSLRLIGTPGCGREVRYVHCQDSLWVNVLEAIYGHQPNGLHHTVKVNYGGVWATINQSIDSLHPNLIIPSLSMSLELRNGHNIKFWTINWIERTTLQYMFPHLFALETFKNYRCIKECFNDGADKWIWNDANSYVFLISNARHLIDNANLPPGNHPTKWSKFVPIVINIFAWCLLLNWLPMNTHLVTVTFMFLIFCVPHAMRFKRMFLISSFIVRCHLKFRSKLLNGRTFLFLNGVILKIFGPRLQTLN